MLPRAGLAAGMFSSGIDCDRGRFSSGMVSLRAGEASTGASGIVSVRGMFASGIDYGLSDSYSSNLTLAGGFGLISAALIDSAAGVPLTEGALLDLPATDGVCLTDTSFLGDNFSSSSKSSESGAGGCLVAYTGSAFM